MAGLPWFELDVDFHDHPKSMALQVALKNPCAEAYVSRVWAYCYRHAVDRFEGAAAVATIESAAKWKGKTGRLVTVLLEVRFLRQEGGSLIVHGVADRLAPHLAKRERDATRARERRADVAATIGRSRADVAGDKDKDSDKDPIGTLQPQIVPLNSRGCGGGNQ